MLLPDILGYIDTKFPFRNPMCKILWYPWHAFLFFGVLRLQWTVEPHHKRLTQLSFDDAISCGWFQILKDFTKKEGWLTRFS
jgi:hypothetical protein